MAIRTHLFSALAALLVLSACQTPRYKEVQTIKPGMDKDEVLQTAGGPNWSERSHDQDKWTYTNPSAPADAKVKEVRFQDGQAVYVGPPIRPKVSAEEQDRINAAADVQQAQIDAANARRHEEVLGAVRANQAIPEGSTPVRVNFKTLDADDQRLQESLYGTSPEQEQKKVAPNFEVVD